MKNTFIKLFLFVFILFFSFLFFNVSAFSDDIITKVFKINSYIYDNIDEIYNLDSMGSAILVEGGIITNAHVILDSNGDPIGNYELCVSSDFRNAPICGIVLKLIAYDEKKDLALLTPIYDLYLGEPFLLKDRTLDLGENIRVYGYPFNGGNTITLTEGKISGYDSGSYKLDANIDNGNSGGGVFDKNGNLVGIPNVAHVGLSTLGYMIPIKTISDFIGNLDTKLSFNIDKDFLNYINLKNNFIKNKKITNKHFDISNFDKYGLYINDIKLSKNNNIAHYELLSFESDTKVGVIQYEIFNKNADFKDFDQENLEQYYQKVIIKNNVKLGNNYFNVFLLVGDKMYGDTSLLRLLLQDVSKKGEITLYIESDIYSLKNGLLPALKWLVSQYVSKNVVSNSSDTFFANNFFNFELSKNIRLVRFFNNYYGYINNYIDFVNEHYNIGDFFVDKICEDICFDNIKFENFVDKEIGHYFQGSNLLDKGIGKTKEGIDYYYVKLGGSDQNFYARYFYSKIDNKIYELAFSFYIDIEGDDHVFVNSLNSFFNSINFVGQSPFSNN